MSVKRGSNKPARAAAPVAAQTYTGAEAAAPLSAPTTSLGPGTYVTATWLVIV